MLPGDSRCLGECSPASSVLGSVPSGEVFSRGLESHRASGPGEVCGCEGKRPGWERAVSSSRSKRVNPLLRRAEGCSRGTVSLFPPQFCVETVPNQGVGRAGASRGLSRACRGQPPCGVLTWPRLCVRAPRVSLRVPSPLLPRTPAPLGSGSP